jgi:hypothetical protein
VSEPNGFSTEKINSVIGTHKLKTPYVNVVSYKVLGAASGTLERRRPFNLQVIVQNTDQGVAENVRVNVTFPANVSRIGGEVESVTLPQLKAGESHLFEYELIANQEAAEELDIKIDLAEKEGRFAQDANIPLQFGQHIGGSIAMNVERRDQEVEIKRVSATTLVGRAPDLIRHYVELRGIGIVDVRRLFGIGSVKETEKINLVINLENWQEGKMYDRFGLDNETVDILGIKVPSILLPVRPGRNLSVVIEVAAMNNRQKRMGYNTAEEFNKRLMESMGVDAD